MICVFWVLTSCGGLVSRHQCFGGKLCHHLQLCRRRRHVPPNILYLPTSPHEVTTQINSDILIAVTISSLAKMNEMRIDGHQVLIKFKNLLICYQHQVQTEANVLLISVSSAPFHICNRTGFSSDRLVSVFWNMFTVCFHLAAKYYRIQQRTCDRLSTSLVFYVIDLHNQI